MRKIKNRIHSVLLRVFYYLCRLLPLKNRVAASSFYGKVYENNPKYVMEAVHRLDSKMPLVWICEKGFDFKLPEYVKAVVSEYAVAYIYATSKIIYNSHYMPKYFRRRKKQIFIMMYHGGIGIKKNSNNVPGRKKSMSPIISAQNTSYCISNSTFMNDVIRNSLVFKGPIWMVGYPKNDILHTDCTEVREKVYSFLGLEREIKTVIYAPTYRLDQNDTSVFNIDFDRLVKALSEKFGGEWKVLLHLHPRQKNFTAELCKKYGSNVIDANVYPDMQELILASNSLISDYSSCIFEAIERKIPCFTYAVDYDTYKDIQGFYFEIDKLPFPYCRNNDELEKEILGFDLNGYLEKWDKFKAEQGLIETNHSAEDIAKKSLEYIHGSLNCFETEELIYD